MQLVNDYERDVYNGDLGRIAAIDRATGTVEVVFDERRLSYSFEELDALARPSPPPSTRRKARNILP